MTDKEKIKAALRFCSDKPDNCIGCPVFSPDDVSDCTSNVMNVAANIIDRLEAESAALREKIEAAVKNIPHDCRHCLHKKSNAGHCALLPDGDEFSPEYTEGFNRDDCDFWAWSCGQEGEEG